MIMRGFLKNYETVSLDNIRTGLKYMNKSIYAHIEVVYTFTKAFYDDFYEVMDRILGKLHSEVRVKELDFKLTVDDIEEFQRSMSDIMMLYNRCLDEFNRVVLLKMNKQSFYDFLY
jgi:hypothetical protein